MIITNNFEQSLRNVLKMVSEKVFSDTIFLARTTDETFSILELYQKESKVHLNKGDKLNIEDSY